MNNEPKISLILPVYNECYNLKENFPKIYSYLKKFGNFEIIIAEDGSVDCTKRVAERYSRLNNVILISKKERMGKGGAIKNGFKIARGQIIGFIDIDLAVPLKHIDEAISLIKSGKKFVIASRYIKGANADRNKKRLFMSIMFNLLIRVLFNTKVKDHQCGFKFIDRDLAKKLAKIVKDNSWFFDAEMIIRAERLGIMPYEMPVEWHERRETKLKRLDILYFLRSALKLKLDLIKSKS